MELERDCRSKPHANFFIDVLKLGRVTGSLALPRLLHTAPNQRPAYDYVFLHALWGLTSPIGVGKYTLVCLTLCDPLTQSVRDITGPSELDVLTSVLDDLNDL
jgi:hypothetical protein